MKEPRFGHTNSGKPVHKDSIDYHNNHENLLGKINLKLGLGVTKVVGTMWAAYVFTTLALFALPSAVHQGTYFVVVWLSSSFLQLVLLPIIIVGQNVQGKASDARSEKMLEDTETIVNAMDLQTEGGLKSIYDQNAEILAILKHQSNVVTGL